MSFGHQLRGKYFDGLDPEVLPVNHGSYGLTPTPIYHKYVEALQHDNSFPDRFIRFELRSNYINLLKALGEFLNVDYHNLAIVDNATTGVNTALRSYPFEKGDKLVVATTGYDSCVHAIRFLQERIGVEVIVVDLVYPLEDEEVVEKFRKAFQKHQPKLALFDTVTSIPGVRVPFEQLVALCREFKVISLIDGAHSIGLMNIDLGKLNPDIYTSNLHKWLYVPRGCAVFYVKPELQYLIQTMPISHSYLSVQQELALSPQERETRFIDKFCFVGSKNFAVISCIIPAIELRVSIGGEKAIEKYCHELCIEVGRVISTEVWPGAAILDNKSKTLITTMINIEVPVREFAKRAGCKPLDFTDLKSIQKCVDFIQHHTSYKDKVYLQLFVHERFYCRFSCQVYNEISDYTTACQKLELAFQEYFSQQ